MLFTAEIAEIFFEQAIDMLDGRMCISLIHHLRQNPIVLNCGEVLRKDVYACDADAVILSVDANLTSGTLKR